MRNVALFVTLPLLAWASVDPVKLKKLSMSAKDVKKMEQMHYGWYVQATSSLLGAMGKELYMKMNRHERKAFVACMDGIEKEHDLQMGAQCLVKAFDGTLVSSYPYVMYSPQYDFVGKDVPSRTREKMRKRTKKKQTTPLSESPFRKHKVPPILHKPSKNVNDANSLRNDVTKTTTRKPTAFRRGFLPVSNQIHPVEQKQRFLAAPKRTPTRRNNGNTRTRLMLRKVDIWEATKKRFHTRRYKRNVLSLYTNKETQFEAKRIDKLDRPFRIRNSNQAPSLLEKKKKTPVKMITDILTGVVRDIRNQTADEQQALHVSFKKLQELQREVAKNKNRNEFKHRMLDMVIGENHPLRRKKTFSDRFRDLVPEMTKTSVEATELVDSIAKHTDTMNYAMLSPRLMPLLPDKYSVNGKRPILSPNLFPLYKDDSDNSILPLPEVLEKSGLEKEDRESILELVMDASGVNDIVTEALSLVRNLKSANLDKDVYKITQSIDDLFLNMKESLNKQQKLDMKHRKYSFLTKDQLMKMYGEQGAYNNTEHDVPFDIDAYGRLSHKEKEEALRNTVRLMANGTLGSFENQKIRRKRQFIIRLGNFSINHFNHITLSPFAFAPTINAMNVLGPITMSPSLFSPSIIGPLLLSPPVLSPSVGNPLIFTPYVLGPNVLSAAVFAVYVFSPYVLAPNVINPYVMSPLILSPYVLCPDVVSPTVLSGAILSPSVLSPSIFTEAVLAANVLSPTFLS